jgi:hypothetical protein
MFQFFFHIHVTFDKEWQQNFIELFYSYLINIFGIVLLAKKKLFTENYD